MNTKTHGALTEGSRSHSLSSVGGLSATAHMTHDRKGREGKGIGSAEVSSAFRLYGDGFHSSVAVCRGPLATADQPPLGASFMNEASR